MDDEEVTYFCPNCNIEYTEDEVDMMEDPECRLCDAGLEWY